MIMCSFHYGQYEHPGHLVMVSNIWWPKIYRGDRSGMNVRTMCLQASMNLKCILKHNQVGKIPEVTEIKEDIALVFTEPFQNAKK